MAVQAQFGNFAPGFLPRGGNLVVEEQVRALSRDLGGALLAGAANNGYYHCTPGVVVSASGVESELTCNGSGGGVSRKRGRDSDLDRHFGQYVSSPSAATGTVPELLWWQQGAETDALVRAECERLRAAALEHARWKRRGLEELVAARAVAAGAAARRLRETEAELEAARRRAAELEERLRVAAAESQAWCGLARRHEAAAAELRAAALDHLLLRNNGGAVVGVGPAPSQPVEGFGESDDDPTSPHHPAGGGHAEDAQSRCVVENAKDLADTAATSAAPAPEGSRRWWAACKACGEREASVLLLPCRHLCACKACEPRLDACPVCLGVKNACIHVAAAS